MNALAVLQILDALLLLTARVPAIKARFAAIRDEVSAVGDRELTPEEWDAVGSRIDDKIARLGKAGE